jgi:hypothetical protein
MSIEMEKGVMLVRTENRPVSNILQSGQFKRNREREHNTF